MPEGEGHNLGQRIRTVYSGFIWNGAVGIDGSGMVKDKYKKIKKESTRRERILLGRRE